MSFQMLKRRLSLLISRALVKAIYDNEEIQKLQVSLLAGELRDKLQRVQNYGFTSHPHPDAEAVVLFSGGASDAGVVIAVDDRRYRVKGLKQGEVVIYTDEGDQLCFKRDRSIEITTQKFKVNCSTCSILSKDNDLVKQLSALLRELIDARVATLAGPQPLVGAGLTQIKQKIDQFIGE